MKKIILLTLALSFYSQANSLKDFISTQDTNTTTIKPYYQGTVVSVEHGGAYTYIEVKEKTEKTFWIAISNSDVKVDDFVRFQKELVMKDFKSKALKRTFKELMFASGLQHKVNK